MVEIVTTPFLKKLETWHVPFIFLANFSKVPVEYYSCNVFNLVYLYMIKEGDINLNSLPLCIAVVGVRTRNIAVLVHTRILYTTNRLVMVYT